MAVLLLCASFPVRFAVPGGRTASLFDVAVLLCLFQLMLMATLKRLPSPPKSLSRALWVLLAVSILSLSWSGQRLTSALDVVVWAEALVVLYFIVAVLRDEGPSVVIRWIALFGLLLLVAPILMYLKVPGFAPPAFLSPRSGDYIAYFTRFSHPFIGRSNNLADLLVILFLPLAYWATRFKRHRFAALLVGVGLTLTLSRGVLLAAALCGFVLVVRSREEVAGKLLRRLLLPLVAGGFVLAAIVTQNVTVSNYLSDRLSDTNIETRFHLLDFARSQIWDNLLLGSGGGVGDDVHNTYLQQVVYFGLVLGGVSAWYLLRAASSFFKQGGVSRSAGMGVVALLISCLFESSLEGSLLAPLLFVCCGLCAALALAAQREEPVVGALSITQSGRRS